MKEEASTAALFRPTPRGIHIRCSNQPRWPGIIVANFPYPIHRLGKGDFVGLARDEVLSRIFPEDSNAIRVEFTDEGTFMRGEGTLKIFPADHSKKKSPDESILIPDGRRVMATFEGFTLKIESI